MLKIRQLDQRITDYFRYHVLANIRLTPVPTSAKEVSFLYENFKTLGNMESFSLKRNKTGNSTYEPFLQVLYSPSRNPLLGSAYLQNEDVFVETDAQLKSVQNALIQDLSSLVALPRYAFIDNDKEFMNGETEIQFKHHLPLNALKFDKLYTINSATVDRPFFRVKSNEVDVDELRMKMKCNFQKFHKFNSIKLLTGLDAVHLGNAKGRVGAEKNDNKKLRDLR